MSDPGGPEMIDPNVGRVLDEKYELVRLLGKGGMGAVYEGRSRIGKRVAVKLLLKPEFASHRELVARFFREAQASAAAESRHVVDVYDTGVEAETGIPFIIMAYLNGEDLEQVGRRVGPLNPVAAARIVSQAATGLAKAHEAGIVHRDIKPANLFLAREEGEVLVKVLDFGIAKVTAESGLSGGGGEGHAITHTGTLLGTPLYMSPEQAQGLKSIDARTDIWSLGMCLYEALAGRMPFDDVDTIGKLIVAIVAHEIRPLSSLAPWVNAELATVVHRALARAADSRWPTARHLIAALQPFTNGSLTITPAVVVGVVDTLGATLAPASPGHVAVVASVPSSLPASGTTGGVFSEQRESSAKRSRSRTVPLAVAGSVALLAAGIVGATRWGSSTRGAAPAAVAASVTVAMSAIPPTPSDPVAIPESDTKVGLLKLKIPDGYTVKVDGVSPGSPGNASAPHAVENGTLELHGEFQRKFMIAVHDKTGKLAMVQDVYLYDNRLDPDVIDSLTGPVKVERPKKPPGAPQRSAGTPSAASAAPPAAPGALPSRY